MRILLLIAALLLASSAFADSFGPDRYTAELTAALETDALSIMVSGTTFNAAQMLCKRRPGSVSADLDYEIAAWHQRNGKYVRASGTALNALRERVQTLGGEKAGADYAEWLLQNTVRAANQRIARQLEGSKVDGGEAPPESLCRGLTRWLRDGVADLERSPGHTRALVPFMQSRSLQ